MLQAIFHAWERRLASATTDRVVRPFEWGVDWVDERHRAQDSTPADQLSAWVSGVMANTDAFYTPAPTADYTLGPLSDGEQLLTFQSALDTPHETNNVVYGRLFHARKSPARTRRAAVVVLPQWNSDAGGHVGLCKLLTMNGLASALRNSG